MSTLFISHSLPDHEIAKELHKALKTLLDEQSGQIKVRYSYSPELGPHGGEKWREWIEKQILKATTVLVILSRESVTRHWPIWEAAACRGVQLLRAHEDISSPGPEIIALRYGIADEDCPDPFRKEQVFSGQTGDDMEGVFTQILGYHSMSTPTIVNAGKKMKDVLNHYLENIDRILLNAPSLVNEASVQDWLSRLENLIEDRRWSELVSFQNRMKIAFGYDQNIMLRQIDLRLHRRLGECHLEQLNYEQAIEQLRYARESAPRDVYVLSRLAESLIKYILSAERGVDLSAYKDEVEDILSRIDIIDPEILYVNPDTAAVAAKYRRKVNGKKKEAIRIYEKSLKLNPESYYLVDVLGQTLIESGEFKEAEDCYREALEIIKKIPDYNVWCLATKTTAHLVLKEYDAAKESANDIRSLKPSLNQLEAIKGGIESVCRKLNIHGETEKDLLKNIGYYGRKN